jgi:hypothetical protein
MVALNKDLFLKSISNNARFAIDRKFLSTIKKIPIDLELKDRFGTQSKFLVFNTKI